MSDDRNIIDYATETRRPPWYRRPLSLVQLLIAILVVAVIVQLLTPTIRRRPYGDYAKDRCLANMRHLEMMVRLYFNAHKSYPDSLATLAGYSDEANRDLFCCQPLNNEAATQPTTQEFIDAILDPASGSYLYLTPGKDPQPGQILLIERTATHSTPSPANVVLVDGSARSISASQHQQILQQINAGQTKIVLPP